MAGKLGIEKTLHDRRRLVDPGPALVGIAEGQRKPLLADRRLSARFGRVRRYKSRVRQQLLPSAADLDEVVTVGAVAMQENHKLSRSTGARVEPRPVEFNGHWHLVSATLSAESWSQQARLRAL